MRHRVPPLGMVHAFLRGSGQEEDLLARWQYWLQLVVVVEGLVQVRHWEMVQFFCMRAAFPAVAILVVASAAAPSGFDWEIAHVAEGSVLIIF